MKVGNRRLFRITQMILAIAAATFITGCAAGGDAVSDESGETVQEGVPVLTDMSITLSLAGNSGTTHGTRAATENNGTTAESAIQRVTVFVVPVDNDGKPVSGGRTTHVTMPWNYSGSGDAPVFTIETTTGKKHIYVAANMTDDQVEAFANEDSEINIADVADITAANRFVMIAQATKDGDPSIAITTDDAYHTIQIDAKLERLAVKVLLVVSAADADNADNESGAYAKLNEKMRDRVWIQRDSLRYIINNVNLRNYYLPHTTADPDVRRDPNFIIGDMLSFNTNTGETAFTGTTAAEFKTVMPEHISDWNPTEAYSAARLDATDDHRYTGGAYCTENFTSTGIPDAWNMTDDQKDVVPMKVATYITMAAKIIPRKIFTKDKVTEETSGTDLPAEFSTMADATAALNSEKPDMSDASVTEEDKANPYDTFYLFNESDFYTYKGMMARINTAANQGKPLAARLTRKNFTAYKGGWEYYLSYIDGQQEVSNGAETGKLLFSEASGLVRNRYYILHVKTIGFPYNARGRDIIKVNTESRMWTDAGSGNVTLE